MKNKSKYNMLRLFLILKGIPFSVISLFVRRNKKLIVFSSFQNMKFDSNSRYLFLWFLKNHPEYSVRFVINDPELKSSLEEKYGCYFIDTNHLSGIMTVLKSGIWFVSALEFPVSGFLMRIRRTVVHLGHGAPLKNVGLMEHDITIIKKMYYAIVRSNISYSLATSSIMKRIVASFTGLRENRILLAGSPRNDQLFKETALEHISFSCDTNRFKVLYAPTWRHYSATKLFPFEDFDFNQLQDFLKHNGICMYLRIHPNFEEEIPMELLNCENIFLFSGKCYPEIMDYMNQFDCLVTDYSSIYFDFLLLNRPVIFLPYDYEEYKAKNGFALDYKKFTPGDKVHAFSDFMSSLLCAKRTPEKWSDERKSVNDAVNSIKRNNCESIFNLLRHKNKL